MALVIRWVLAAFVCFALLACGGGGGGGGSAGTMQPPASAPAAAEESSFNRPPTIAGNPAKQIAVGMNYRFRPVASDLDGDPLSFQILSKPAWANFNNSTGRLEGKPRPGDVGKYERIRIKVTDGKATTQLASFTIEVLGSATGGFTLSWNPPTRNTDGSVVRDLAGYRIYLGTQSGNYSNVFEIDNPGLTTYVFDQLAPGTYYVAITAIDADSNESPRSRELTETI